MKVFLWLVGVAILAFALFAMNQAAFYAKEMDDAESKLITIMDTFRDYKVVSTPYTIQVWIDDEMQNEYPKDKEFTLEFRGQ